MANRLELLEEILDSHITNLHDKEDEIILNDTKQLVELLKAVQLLDAVKRLDGIKSIYDDMQIDELEKALADE